MQVGISSVWYEGNPCNMHLLDLANYVKEGVQAAGMVGFRYVYQCYPKYKPCLKLASLLKAVHQVSVYKGVAGKCQNKISRIPSQILEVFCFGKDYRSEPLKSKL